MNGGPPRQLSRTVIGHEETFGDESRATEDGQDETFAAQVAAFRHCRSRRGAHGSNLPSAVDCDHQKRSLSNIYTDLGLADAAGMHRKASESLSTRARRM